MAAIASPPGNFSPSTPLVPIRPGNGRGLFLIATYLSRLHGGGSRLLPSFKTSVKELDIPRLASKLRRCDNLSEGKLIHDHISKHGLHRDRFLANLVIDMYGKFGALEEAEKVFDNMQNRNVFTWNIMIGVYIRHQKTGKALALFAQMPKKDAVSWNSMIRVHSQQGMMQEARRFFEQMPNRDTISWNMMIQGYANHGRMEEALECFVAMPMRDEVSWTVIIEGYARQGMFNEASLLFEQMPVKDLVVCNAIISAYARDGQMDEANKFFRRMSHMDAISWTSMIMGYAKLGQLKESIQHFQEMKLKSIMPDRITFVTILDACAENAALNEGKMVHLDTEVYGFKNDNAIDIALLNMYAKCGSLEDACALFDKIPERGVVSCTAMITGYALHGQGFEALKLFKKMHLDGVRPNKITFCSLLSACSNTGLSDLCYHSFVSMSGDYGVRSSLEHYTCPIGLLGKHNQLDEAVGLIESMPVSLSIEPSQP